jgi:hypothetical protein
MSPYVRDDEDRWKDESVHVHDSGVGTRNQTLGTCVGETGGKVTL